MIAYRIDTWGNGDWKPGSVTFNAAYPYAAIDEAARELNRILDTPVRIVLVDEITLEHVEEIAVFGVPVDQAA